MEKAWRLFRLVLVFLLAAIATLASFGMILAGLWHIGLETPTFQWISSGISAAAALWLGGLIVAWFYQQESLLLSLFFGACFGGFSFVYILGVDPAASLLTLLSGIVAGLGGLVVQRTSSRREVGRSVAG